MAAVLALGMPMGKSSSTLLTPLVAAAAAAAAATEMAKIDALHSDDLVDLGEEELAELEAELAALEAA
jgi:hypothetical protein